MPDCTRCGSDTDEGPPNSDYSYCDDCMGRFREVRENGVWVRYLMNHAGIQPEGYYVSAPAEGDSYAGSQTAALSLALELMEENGFEGRFDFRPTGSRWLIDEYLEAHPSIADDVKPKQSGGLIGKIFG